MPSSLQRCRSCGTVGKVHRSKPRNRREEVVRFLVPVYGIYRCHNCNWRGWLPRGRSSPVVRKLLVGFYVILVVTVLGIGFSYVKRKFFPKPYYEYPVK
jgi:hypothetical protein